MKTTPTPTPPSPPSLRKAQLTLATALIAFLAAATLPYLWLIEHFGYDDVLREPAADILVKFHAGGALLVLAWFAFSMSALLFIPVALGFDRLLAAHRPGGGRTAVLGIASAIAQAVGLLRWVLVVPALAAAFTDPDSTPAVRDAVTVVFSAVHLYGGSVVGEMVGQLLLAGWTAGVALQLWRSRAVPRWLAAGGLATLPLWLAGQTELLHGVVPAVPLLETIPIAFMAWEAWLAALAITLLLQAASGRHVPRSVQGDAMPA